MTNPATALTVRSSLSTLPNRDEWTMMGQMATAFSKAGMFGHLKSPEAFVVAMLKGQELGFGVVWACQNIYVIGGNPALKADGMRAIIQRDHGDDAFRIIESTDSVCTIDYKRRSWKQAERCTFSMADAQRAEVANSNAQYKKYPRQMLFARCSSDVARRAFSDSLAGCYTPEDLGAYVMDDGRVIEADAQPSNAERVSKPALVQLAPPVQPSAASPLHYDLFLYLGNVWLEVSGQVADEPEETGAAYDAEINRLLANCIGQMPMPDGDGSVTQEQRTDMASIRAEYQAMGVSIVSVKGITTSSAKWLLDVLRGVLNANKNLPIAANA